MGQIDASQRKNYPKSYIPAFCLSFMWNITANVVNPKANGDLLPCYIHLASLFMGLYIPTQGVGNNTMYYLKLSKIPKKILNIGHGGTSL